jgi:hypothetical protein
MAKRTTYLKVLHDESQFISAGWAAHKKISKEVSDQILFSSEGGTDSEKRSSFAVARYDFKGDSLSDPVRICYP